MSDVLEQIAGGAELCGWFGGVPTFADGLVIDFQLLLESAASLTLRTWPLAPNGAYRLEEPAEVTFKLERVIAVNLVDLVPSSVMGTLSVVRTGQGYLINLEAAYGLQGTIEAEAVSVSFLAQLPGEAR